MLPDWTVKSAGHFCHRKPFLFLSFFAPSLLLRTHAPQLSMCTVLQSVYTMFAVIILISRPYYYCLLRLELIFYFFSIFHFLFDYLFELSENSDDICLSNVKLLRAATILRTIAAICTNNCLSR